MSETKVDLTWLPGYELSRMIKEKELSPIEVVEFFLKRIEKYDPMINAYVTVDYEGARRQAKELAASIERGEEQGLLCGLPISIKDLYMTKRLRTTQGSLAYEDAIPQIDEILVERLKKAGAIIIGKVQTSEFALFIRTKTLLAGECLNPWDTKRISGASSGGSAAAVAGGISCFSIGSDGGGSTRIPSALNGVVGFHPSAGRVPQRTPIPFHMSSPGPITLYVRDAANIAQVISGFDPRDPSAIEYPTPDFASTLDDGIEGFKIAWSRDFGVVPEVDSRVNDMVEESCYLMRKAGAIIETPDLDWDEESTWNLFPTLNEIALQRMGKINSLTDTQKDKLTPYTKQLVNQMGSVTALTPDMKWSALESRAQLIKWFNNIFDQYDLICTPTMGVIAPPIPDGNWEVPYKDECNAKRMSGCFTYIANFLGLPAVTVPCGFVDGMPVGLQIYGKRLDDVKVMQAAQAFSKLKPWMDIHPDLT